MSTILNDIPPLPVLYHSLHSKRGIPVNKLRKLEKATLQVAKKLADIRFWHRCIALKLCPEFLKFKPPRLKQYNNIQELYEIVVRKSLEQSKRELTVSEAKLQSLKREVNSTISPTDNEMLESALQSNCNEFMKQTEAIHNKKLLKLWFKQRPRSPDCVLNLSDRTLSLEERNVLYKGLKHHILPKRINTERLKANIEKLCKTLVDRTKSEGENSDVTAPSDEE